MTYHHLLDPRTGCPMPLAISSVSILPPEAVYTDLVSTAFFILGVEKGEALLAGLAQDGVEVDYVALLADGTLRHSPGAEFAKA